MPRDTGHASPDGLRITVVFNNVPFAPGLRTGRGFSCLVRGAARTVLFDTGADGGVLLGNMRRLGLEPTSVDGVMLSHFHGDHTSGLGAFLTAHGDVDVWTPDPPPAGLRRSIADLGARVEPVTEAGLLCCGIASTGPMGDTIVEQALIVDVGERVVVVTGCAHPGIDRVAQAATTIAGRPIRLLMGGFHLKAMDRSQIRRVIKRLREFGVETVAPGHCTGELAIAAFREAWGADFVEGGLGAVIDVFRR